jgi:hypothetical protein
MRRSCIACGRKKAIDEFGSAPARKDGLDPRCKLCIAEQAKRSIRFSKGWPRFETEVKKWPLVKIESEIDWLTRKLKRLNQERRRRP